MSESVETFLDHVSKVASVTAFQKHQEDALISAEALPEGIGLIDFKTFAHDYPEKLFSLIVKLRPEFQELFVEYWILGKSQNFLAKCHGQIQTRIWQNLRVIERTLGALIVLGTAPTEDVLRPILAEAGLEQTACGSLAEMIVRYANSQSYVVTAGEMKIKVSAVRKTFRPAIKVLLAAKSLKSVAVGSYLRGITHHASLSKTGLSNSYHRRTERVKRLKFLAPSSEVSPMVSFGPIETLDKTPWCMLEISSDDRIYIGLRFHDAKPMSVIMPALLTQAKRIFGKKPAQIFAPLTAEGDLELGYIFVRSTFLAGVRALTHVLGISEMASIYNDSGSFVRAVTIPHDEVQKMLKKHKGTELPNLKPQDFVEILTGPAAHYCGTVTRVNKSLNTIRVEVNFPTGRKFVVSADPTCLRPLPCVPSARRAFWGEIL